MKRDPWTTYSKKNVFPSPRTPAKVHSDGMTTETETRPAPEAPRASNAPTSALTRAALVDLEPDTSHDEAAQAVASLRRRGYNTAVVPILREGELMLKTTRPAQKGKRAAKKGNPALAALDKAFKLKRLSCWILVDPLAAGPRHLGQLGRLARKRREWLIRNTGGHLLPVGSEDRDPVFSWMNGPYRRFLGDLIFDLAQSQPISGVILDLRRYPGISRDSERWYCCSFDSQVRAEDDLEISFERLVSSGAQRDITRWQQWVVGQLRHFIECLVARTRTARGDVSWKVLAPHSSSDDPFEAPWLPCLAEGLIDELIVMHEDRNRDFLLHLEHYDEVAGRPALVMPCYDSERDAAELAGEFETWPVPGFLTLCPSTNEGPVLPDCRTRWNVGGALEDEPVAALHAIAGHLEEGFGTDNRLGRFCRELKEFFAAFEPEPAVFARTDAKIQSIRARLFSGEVEIPDDKRALLREVDLMARLLSTVKFDVSAD